ncbi:MAG TPA: SDR family oxidoreductase [Caulobacteraceae bacterium]|jgi:NAD(P)-dependent dehydrogenase (short-subunit alcohol dehydrogenase family)|nr:SDR family oxidoreductase [Caulobacteraceae bacterium]
MADRGGALITGAARRIGRALALTAAEAGYAVAIHHRHSDAEAHNLAEDIEASGRRAAILSADLADPAACARLVAEAAEATGGLSLLVNNASIFDDDRIGTLTPATWDAHMAANLRAPVLLAQAFAAQASDGGLIVNILDQRVWRPTPQFFSYAVSKAALWQATRMLAQALAPKIRVNGIGPGPTLPSAHQSIADFDAEARNVPLGHHTTPEEIAAALAYLIDARSVTGQMIAVDAGQHLAWRTPDVIAP